MGSASEWTVRLAPAAMLFKAIVASVAGISALMIFIMVRRWWRARYFARRERLRFKTRKKWNDLISGKVKTERWRYDPVASEVLETMLLDAIEVSSAAELPRLVECLRRSGLLDRRIEEARSAEDWRRWGALVALGRTRAPEAVPALAEALDSPDIETRISALRGVGKLAMLEAATPVLDRLAEDRLTAPWAVLKNALLNCCGRKPEILLRYMANTQGKNRELLARVLSELADASASDDLLILSGDTSAEVRAAAARALSRVEQQVAIPPLALLASDAEWFVRLRAVVALGSFSGSDVDAVLVRALGDRNRLVRQRAAWALMKATESLWRALRQVVDAGDNYGLQAVVAELERSGRFADALEKVNRQAGPDAERVAAALEAARCRLALEAEGEKKEEVGVA